MIIAVTTTTITDDGNYSYDNDDDNIRHICMFKLFKCIVSFHITPHGLANEWREKKNQKNNKCIKA